jgi:hypothetical protein
MKPRTAHLLRSQQTLLAHELREQGPMGLCVLVAGAAILFSVRLASGVQPGDVGAQLPYFVPALAALLLAFPAADLLGRDTGSGLARTFAAAPVDRVRLMPPRLVVFMLVVTIVVGALLTLEPPRSALNIRTTEASLVPLTGLLLCVALSGAVLPSAIAALITGVVVCYGTLIGLTLVSRWRSDEADLTAAVQVFADAFMGSLSVGTLLPSGLAALFIARALRGPGARRWIGRLRGAFAAALLFVAPPTALAALETHATIDVAFDDPDASVHVGVSDAPGRVFVRVGAMWRPWASTWEVDVDTTAKKKLGEWPVDRRQERFLYRYWLAEPHRRESGLTLAKLRFDDGSISELLRIRRQSFPNRSSPRDLLVYISDVPALHIVSLVDGTSRQLADVPELDLVLSLNLSPDGRWLALGDYARSEPGRPDRSFNRVRLIDTRSGEVVESLDNAGFRAWRCGPDPMVVVAPIKVEKHRETSQFLVLGPNGATPFPIDQSINWLEQLADGRFVCVTQDDRVLLLGADGTTERTLRAPRPVSRR